MAEILIEGVRGDEVAENTEPATIIEGTMVARGERGMTTAEYAMGVIAACTLAGVLVFVFKDGSFQKLMLELVSNLFRTFMTKH